MVTKATTATRTDFTTKERIHRRKALPEPVTEVLQVRLVSVTGSAVVTLGRGEAKISRAATKMRKRKKKSQSSRIRTPSPQEAVASK